MAAWCQPGIGQAVATALVKRGDTVVFADVNADGAKQVVASLGSRALAVGLDVGDADAVTQLVVDNVVGEIVAAVRPGMPVPRIAEVACTSPDRVRDVIHNFDADGFDALYPRYRGGRPATFSADQRAEITKVARGRPTDHGLPVSTLEPAEAGRVPGRQGVVAKGWSTIISHQGLGLLLGQEGGSVQRVQSAEDLDRPERRDQEEPGARAACDRRRPSGGPTPVTPRSSSAWTSSGR